MDGIVYNTLQVQPLHTNICDVFCLFVLYKMSINNCTFENTILEIDNSLNSLFKKN